MRSQLEKRLQELKKEFENGTTMKSELESKLTNLDRTLLRIHGAIQVLEEELAKVGNNQNVNSVQPVYTEK